MPTATTTLFIRGGGKIDSRKNRDSNDLRFLNLKISIMYERSLRPFAHPRGFPYVLPAHTSLWTWAYGGALDDRNDRTIFGATGSYLCRCLLSRGEKCGSSKWHRSAKRTFQKLEEIDKALKPVKDSTHTVSDRSIAWTIMGCNPTHQVQDVTTLVMWFIYYIK